MLRYIPFIIVVIIIFLLIIFTILSLKVLISICVGPDDVHAKAPKREKTVPKPKPQTEIRQKTPKPTPTPVIAPVPEPTPKQHIPSTPLPSQTTPVNAAIQERKNQIQLKINSINSMIESLDNQYRNGNINQQQYIEKKIYLGEKLGELQEQLQTLD